MAELEDDRRRHPRFLCAGIAEIRSLASGRCVRGKIANLSLEGCLIALAGDPCDLRKNESVEMTFTVRQLPLRVQGTVRQHHGDEALGIQFTLLTERGKRQLLQLIEELADLRRDQLEGLVARRNSDPVSR